MSQYFLLLRKELLTGLFLFMTVRSSSRVSRPPVPHSLSPARPIDIGRFGLTGTFMHTEGVRVHLIANAVRCVLGGS